MQHPLCLKLSGLPAWRHHRAGPWKRTRNRRSVEHYHKSSRAPADTRCGRRRPQACSRASKRGFPHEARRRNEASSCHGKGGARWSVRARGRRRGTAGLSLCPWLHPFRRREPNRAPGWLVKGPAGENDGATRAGVARRAGATARRDGRRRAGAASHGRRPTCTATMPAMAAKSSVSISSVPSPFVSEPKQRARAGALIASSGVKRGRTPRDDTQCPMSLAFPLYRCQCEGGLSVRV